MHACTPLIFDSGENSDDYTQNHIELHSKMKKLITEQCYKAKCENQRLISNAENFIMHKMREAQDRFYQIYSFSSIIIIFFKNLIIIKKKNSCSLALSLAKLKLPQSNPSNLDVTLLLNPSYLGMTSHAGLIAFQIKGVDI